MPSMSDYGNGVGGLRPGPHCSLNSMSPHRDVLLLTYLLTYLSHGVGWPAMVINTRKSCRYEVTVPVWVVWKSVLRASKRRSCVTKAVRKADTNSHVGMCPSCCMGFAYVCNESLALEQLHAVHGQRCLGTWFYSTTTFLPLWPRAKRN